MKIFTQFTSLSDKFPNITVALGTFDGVHIGHKQIISQAVNLAKEIHGTSVVFTFSNHPLSVIAPERCPLQLVTPEYKAELIENMGVDILLTIPFTLDFLKLTPQEFIEGLMNNLRPKHIVVGPNYSFGFKSRGNPALLQEAGEKYGFAVAVHDGVYVNDQIVSSTLIRQLILEGCVDRAAVLLGRSVTLKGQVVHGEKRGRLLGYPTVNLQAPTGLVLPKDGVYAATIKFQGQYYQAVANIGCRPTFDGANRNIEIHILGFNQEIYGEVIVIEFIQRIRSEKIFATPEDLIDQIASDVATAKDILG